MKTRTILTLACTAALLTSCKLGPDWAAPNMAVPDQFRGKGIGGSTMADLPWQDVLSDSNLKALLQDTLNNNRNLVAMQHNVSMAQRYVTMARAPLFPWFGYAASTSKGKNQSGGMGIANMGGHTTMPGSVALNASWELDLWGKTRRKVESTEAAAKETEEQCNNLRASMLKQVAIGYLQLLMLDEQLEIARNSVKSYRESLDLFQQQFEVGTSDGLQTASAKAALSAAEAQIPNLEMQIAELENTLSALAGRMPGHIARSGSLSRFAASSKVASGIPADVLSRRPDIRAKEQALRAANAEIGVAIASYFPTISLTAAGGFASGDLRNAIVGRSSGWGIGASLTGPLFQAGQLRANEKAKRDAFLAAKAEYEGTVLNAMAEVSSTLVQREKLREVIAKQEKAVAAYEESVKLAKTRFAEGYAAYYEVLNNQLYLFPALQQLAAYRFQYASTVPALYTQLGGGWKR